MKNLKLFKRSDAEKESQVCYRSSSSDNVSRDETSYRILEHRRRDRCPKDKLSSVRQPHNRRRPKYECEYYTVSEYSIEEKQGYGRRRDSSTLRFRQSDSKRDTRRYNRDESWSKLCSQKPEPRKSPNTRSDVTSSSTMRNDKPETYSEVKLQTTYGVQKRDDKTCIDKRPRPDKANTSERLLTVTSFDDLPTKETKECESEENIFPIVGFTKSSTSVSSNIIFIPIAVYPNEQNEKRKETFNQRKDKQYKPLKGDEKFYVNIQDIGSIFQQKPTTEPTTSLDTSQGSRSANDETMYTHTKSLENKTPNTGGRPRLHEKSKDKNTQGKTINQGVSEELCLSSERGLKQYKDSYRAIIPILGSTRKTASKAQLHVDSDYHNVGITSINTELKFETKESNILTTTPVPKQRGVTIESSYSNRTAKAIETSHVYHSAKANASDISDKIKINDSKVTNKIKIKDSDSKTLKMLINENAEENYGLRPNTTIKVKPKRASEKVNSEEVKIISTNKNVNRKQSDSTSNNKKDKSLSKSNKNNYGFVRHEQLRNPTHHLDESFHSRDMYCKLSSKSASQNESNISDVSKFRIPKTYGRQPQKDDNRDKMNSLLAGKKSYDLSLTDRPGFMTKVNNSVDLLSQEVGGQVNREWKENTKWNKTQPCCSISDVECPQEKCTCENPTNSLDESFHLRDMYFKLSSKSASQNGSNISDVSKFRIPKTYGRQLQKDDNRDKMNSLGDRRKSYNLSLTDRPGFMIKVNSRVDTHLSQEIGGQVNREWKENTKWNKTQPCCTISDDEHPQEKFTNGEVEEKGIIGLASRCVMEGCRILLGTSPHSIVMAGIDVFGVVKEKMQSNKTNIPQS